MEKKKSPEHSLPGLFNLNLITIGRRVLPVELQT
jgi:hypothetical protein